jgi:hypothetical protein
VSTENNTFPFHLTIAAHSVRAAVNAGGSEYNVTADFPPSFMYEDPEKYDPENVLEGLMRGNYLLRVSKYQTLPDIV